MSRPSPLRSRQLGTPSAHADEASDQFALDAVGQTHLAYVVTGNADLDEASRAGLSGLSQVLAERTALEPGDPIGVDPARDELTFFPLLYWPIDPDSPLPDLRHHGEDRCLHARRAARCCSTPATSSSARPVVGTFSGTPAVERLRDMLSSLDIPPLEPVPADHVLTKAFYLLSDFPGRYAGGPLWVEANQGSEPSHRIARPAPATASPRS